MVIKQEKINQNIKIANKYLIIFSILHTIISSISYALNFVEINMVGPNVLIQYIISKVIITNKIKKEKIRNIASYVWKTSFIVLFIRWVIGIIIGTTLTPNYINKTDNKLKLYDINDIKCKDEICYNKNNLKITGKVIVKNKKYKWLPSILSSYIQKEIQYKDGKIEGDYIEYYKNGKIQSKSHYENGKRNGIFNYYCPQEFLGESIIQEETFYKNGKKEGISVKRHCDVFDQYENQTPYKNDKKNGLTTIKNILRKDLNNNIMEEYEIEIVYENDNIVSKRIFEKDGDGFPFFSSGKNCVINHKNINFILATDEVLRTGECIQERNKNKYLITNKIKDFNFVKEFYRRPQHYIYEKYYLYYENKNECPSNFNFNKIIEISDNGIIKDNLKEILSKLDKEQDLIIEYEKYYNDSKTIKEITKKKNGKIFELKEYYNNGNIKRITKYEDEKVIDKKEFMKR